MAFNMILPQTACDTRLPPKRCHVGVVANAGPVADLFQHWPPYSYTMESCIEQCELTCTKSHEDENLRLSVITN